ncbi:hypothetical protein ACWA2C_27945 [Priestia megaterium]
MNEILNRLDINKTIGTVTLTDGQKLKIPKLSISKLLGVVKFLGTEGARIYSEIRELLLDESIEGLEKLTLVMGSLKEEQLVKIFSIVLDIEVEEALALDINEMLDVITVYIEETNIKKTFLQIRKLYKSLYGKEMPTFKEIMDDMFPEVEKARQEAVEKQQAAMQATASAGENS